MLANIRLQQANSMFVTHHQADDKQQSVLETFYLPATSCAVQQVFDLIFNRRHYGSQYVAHQ